MLPDALLVGRRKNIEKQYVLYDYIYVTVISTFISIQNKHIRLYDGGDEGKE